MKNDVYVSKYAFYAKYIDKQNEKRHENYSFFGIPKMKYRVIFINTDDYIVRLEEENGKYEIEITIDMLEVMFELQ